MNASTRAVALVLTLSAALAACGDEVVAPASSDTDPAVQKLVEMGFRADMIENHGDYLVVEGDIQFARAELLRPDRAAPARAPQPGGPRFQYTTTATVSSANVQTIKVDLSGLSSDAGYVQAVRDAIGYWSGISGSYIKIVEGSPADIRFVFENLGTGVMGRGDFPSGGVAGDTVRFNPYFTVNGSAPSYAAKVKVAVHELGHNIGFRHSNWNQVDCYPSSCNNNPGSVGAVQVGGTPSSGNDGSSVMNGGTAGTTWAGFSTYDQVAARTVYPLPAPAGFTLTHPSGTVYLTWNPVVGASYYEVQRVEVYHDENGYEGWSYSTTYEGGWNTVYDTFFETGSSWTGASTCIWYQDAYGQTYSDYWWEVRAVFPNGNSAYINSTGAQDGSC
ncbi:MAG: M57 family metalloprotease [Longimicrobiaceae bacterium]